MGSVEETAKYKMVSFTPKLRDKLRKVYKAAARNGDKSFMFEGNEYLVAYAKYMLEYLDTKLD